jgi:hypothetical protein
MPAFIIGDTCTIDSKNCPVFRDSGHVTRYEERDKNFFRKIEICAKILSIFVENASIYRGVDG